LFSGALITKGEIMDMNTSTSASRDKLMEDLRLVVEDAEDLLQVTSHQAGEKAAAARARIQESLNAAKDHLADAERNIIERTRHAAKATNDYVHENPWKAVGISAAVGACVGIVIGMLIGRR
jgi:ElaB/YqjD/DUF883 family membrane-anchored ribosome-binding protein